MTTDITNLFAQTSNAAIRKALRELGQYYGVKDQNTFVSILLKKSLAGDGKLSLPSSTELDKMAKEEDTYLKDLANAIMSLQGDGAYADELVKIFDTYAEGGQGKDDRIAEMLKSTGSDTDTKQEYCPISITLTKNTKPEALGYLRKDGIDQLYSDKFKMPEILNNNHTKTDENRRSISIIEIHNPLLNFSNRDTAASSLFLMSLPSIEISKAVPYFDMKTITKGIPLVKMTEQRTNPGSAPDTYRTFGNGISIYKFLNGERVEEKSSTIHHLASFQPVGMNSGPSISGGVDGPDPATQQSNVAGMEIFTSPQTMVDGTLQHIDLDTTSKNYGSADGPKNIPMKNKVLDKFRPLMTVKSFNVQVTPATGMIATKAANVKLTLHDKTRMNQIMPLIIPGQLGDVEFLIEWGWSHPHSDPEVNPYGALINSMRCKEKYGVMNSSYSFTADGQVEIDLKLYTKGAQKAAFELISSAGDGEGNVFDTLDKLVTELKGAMKEMKQNSFTPIAEMGAPDTLGKITSSKGLLSLAPKEVKAIRKFLDARKSKNSSEHWKKLSESFAEAFGSDKKGGKKTGGVQAYQAKLQEMFKSQIDNCCTRGADSPDDPYLPHGLSSGKVPNTPKVPVNIHRNTHVSLAKVLNTFVATPLMNTGRFQEVQMVFYPMNQYAMWARSLNVGQYPINKKDLEDEIKKALKTTTSMTISSFLNFIKKNFIGFVGDDIYGLSDFYGTKESRMELAKKHTKSDKSKAAFADSKESILKKCYGDGIKTFKKPSVQMFIECVGHVGSEDNSILRLHFFDRQCSSYESYASMWAAASAKDIGVIGSYKQAESQFNHTSTHEPKPKADKKTKERYAEVKKNREARVNQYKGSAIDAQKSFIANGLIEEFTYETVDRITGDNVKATKFRIKGGPDQLRGILAANMPTLKHGTEFSGVISANLSTNSNPQMETIHMQRQGSKSGPAGAPDMGLPMQIKPVELSMETFGCPFINFGQQFFCDFQTNTTTDDIYAVSGVSHSLSPGEFKTSIKMTPLNKLGQFRSLTDTIDSAVAIAAVTAKNTDGKKPG